MALPKQVQQQLEEVTAIEEAMKAPAVAPAEQTAANENPPPENAVPAEEAPKPEVVTSNVVELKPEQAPAPQPDLWEHKYNTLQSKYNAEVPRLHAQVKELTGKLADITADLEKVKATPKDETPKQPAVTDKDKEAFGEDLIDLQRRIANEVLSSVKADMDALRGENATLRAQLGDTGSQVSTLSFEQRLYKAVPDFEQLNADPKWVAWLDEVDPMLRGPRRMMAQDAYERGDVAAVADYVDLFKRSQNVITRQQVQADTQSELQSQVAPSRTTTATVSTAATADQRFYTEVEASRLFDKVGTLNRAGKYEEASKLESELTLAYQTGRVRG